MKQLLGLLTVFSVSLWIIPSYAGVTSDKDINATCGWNKEKSKQYRSEIQVLSESAYPWGVCVRESNFSSEVDNWTRVAFQQWNKEYTKYKIRRWGTSNVLRIPHSPLFVESCNSDKYNLIFTNYNNEMPDDKLAWYADVDPSVPLGIEIFARIFIFPTNIIDLFSGGRMFSEKPLMGLIEINQNKYWEREFFINIMIHELGHALGIEHILPKGSNYTHPDDTEIMQSSGFGCDDYENNICNLKNVDFESFLRPYGAGSAITKEKYEEEQEKARKKEFQRRMSLPCGGGLVGPTGICA